MTSPALQRYVPLLAWIVAVTALLAIPCQIFSTGFIPAGDARRHVAKVMTDKEYNEILLLRPEYKIDHSPGWDWILRRLHRMTGWDEDHLMGFSVVTMMLCVLLAGLPWVRRPEAWLAAALAQLVAVPETMQRLDQGRPFLLTEGVFICVLFAWAREAKPSWSKMVLTAAGCALSVWVHGAWYLWVFVLGGFFLAGAWGRCWRLAVCWVAGVVVGAGLTGKPFEFLYGAVYMAASVAREHAPKSLLVGEFQPSDGEFYTLAVLALVYLWRWQRNQAGEGLMRQPVFWMIAIFWTLGLQADRFWADWGLPSALVWLALQFDEWMVERWPVTQDGLGTEASSPRPSPPNSFAGEGARRGDSPAVFGCWPGVALGRLLLCGMIAAPLFLDATSDLKSRYTRSLRDSFVNGSDPALQGWLPPGDGIIYSADMSFFYDTFYRNPQGNWRYSTGFEPALMPEDDLKILRKIQWNRGDWAAYEPWIAKLRPQDRLEIAGYGPPPLPQLEWRMAADGIWIGRKPKGK